MGVPSNEESISAFYDMSDETTRENNLRVDYRGKHVDNG